MFRRSGRSTLEAGIEYVPSESRWAPAGRTVGSAPRATTSRVAADTAWLDPSGSVAATSTRSVLPTSAAWATYAFVAAPAISAQFAPAASQRCHWYAYVTPSTRSHAPSVAVSVSPSRGVPVTPGSAFAVGRSVTAETAAYATPVSTRTAATTGANVSFLHQRRALPISGSTRWTSPESRSFEPQRFFTVS